MKRLLIILALFAQWSMFNGQCSMVFAQDAMKVLDITADHIRKAGNVKIEYKASVFAGATEKFSTSGTMWLQESKMKLEAEDSVFDDVLKKAVKEIAKVEPDCTVVL